jgi:hypothetical protein
VPVVGRLQARRERGCGLQVPGGLIGMSSDVVGELWSVYVVFPTRRLMSHVPRGEGVHLPFIDQGEGELQACGTIQLHEEVWCAASRGSRPP